MTDAHRIARDQLRSFIERVERLSEEKKAISDDMKDVYAEAKGTGFCVKTIKRIVALRKKSENERSEEEALLDTYMSALGMIQRDLFDSHTGEIISTSAGDSDLTPAVAAHGSEESAAFNSTMEAAE